MVDLETNNSTGIVPSVAPKMSFRDASFFDQLKNANFQDLGSLIRNYKTNNVLQQSNSPDLQNKQKLIECNEGKENSTRNLTSTKNCQKIVQISQILDMTICKTSSFVDFGSSLPGYVLEEALILQNLTSVPFSIKATVLCFDDEMNELDEYVFSVRKEDNYEYNESQVCKIGANGSAKLFVALKAPNLKIQRKITGIVQVRVNGAGVVSGVLEKDIQAYVKVPKIVCLKELYSTEYQQQVIKLAMKIVNGRADCKVPFKNQMAFTVKAEFELINGKKSGDEYEFAINPEFGVLQPNQMAMVVIVGKKNEVKNVSKTRDGVKKNDVQQKDGIRERKNRAECGAIDKNRAFINYFMLSYYN